MNLQQTLHWFYKVNLWCLYPLKAVLSNIKGWCPFKFEKNDQPLNGNQRAIDWYHFWPTLAFFGLSLFAMVPESSINSCTSWFIFNLRKIKSNQYRVLVSDAGIVVRHIDTRQYNDKAYNYYTYLNSGLLWAPREYVLHGLVLGLDWAPLWPHPISMHLVAMANSVSCCL